jgi:serine protease
MGGVARGAAVLSVALGLSLVAQVASGSEALASESSSTGVHYFVPRGARRSGGGGGTNLFFHDAGASVEVTPHIYLSFWGPEWTTLTDAEKAQSYTSGFFSNVGGSSWLNTTTQYCKSVPASTVDCSTVNTAVKITNPGNQSDVFNDPTPVPSHPRTRDIVAAALRLETRFGFHADALYMVLTPSGKSQAGFGTSFCAYHSAVSTTSGPVAVAYVPYQSDSATCNDNPARLPYGGFSISGGHEYAEAQTDPFPASAWLDGNGAEIGDKCETTLDTITLNSSPYAVQALWSNAFNKGAGGCVTAYP